VLTDKTRIFFVGGFLGAGKTTLLWKAAQLLAQRGKRVGLITNDQAPDLVDTRLLAEKGHVVREVAGSCFCCNFNGLIDAIDCYSTRGRSCLTLNRPSAVILNSMSMAKSRFIGRMWQ